MIFGGNFRTLHASDIATLRTMTGDIYINRTAVVEGYYTPGDGGGGPKRYWEEAAPGTYTDTGGNIIVPDTVTDGSAAWVWGDVPEVDIRWYGASTSLADNSTFINKAIITHKKEVPLIVSGSYTLTSPLVPYDGTVIRGTTDRYRGLSQLVFNNSYAISITDVNVNASNRVTGVIIDGITFTGNDTTDFEIRNITAGFGDLAFGQIINCKIEKFDSCDLVLTGMDIQKNDFFNCTEFVFKGGDNAIYRNYFSTLEKGTINGKCISFPGSGNMRFYKNYVTAGVSEGDLTDNPIGISLDAASDIFIEDNWIDLSSTHAIKITNTENVTVKGNKMNACAKAGTQYAYMQIENSSNIDATLNMFQGIASGGRAIGIDGTAANTHDIHIYNNQYEEHGREVYEGLPNDAGYLNVTVNENYPEFKDYAFTSNTKLKMQWQNATINNREATANFNMFVDDKSSVGTTYRITRIADFNIGIFNNEAPQGFLETLSVNGPRVVEITKLGTGDWSVIVLDTDAP